MAKLIKTPMPGRAQLNQSVQGTPDSIYEDTFDSTFERSVVSDQNCTLRLKLRIFFRQINPDRVSDPYLSGLAAGLGTKTGIYPDSDKQRKLIKEWTPLEWTNFLHGVDAQARLWDGKFWLIPPADFSYLDIVEGSWTNQSGQTVTRPNVKCEFELTIAHLPSYAHKSIDVVNLVGAVFRSDSRLYAGTDIVPQSKGTRYTAAGLPVTTVQPVVAHEIGHALGLPHIGNSRTLAPCNVAVMLEKGWPDWSIPALYKGGSNADACYGADSGAADINNIMGAGAQFSEENAAPWLDRLIHDHLNLDQLDTVKVGMGYKNWKVSMVAVAPRVVP